MRTSWPLRAASAGGDGRCADCRCGAGASARRRETSTRLSIDTVPLAAWAGTIALVLALFALDFVVGARRPHVVEMREATF